MITITIRQVLPRPIVSIIGQKTKSVLILKISDLIQPLSDIPLESEVTEKIARQTVKGILKFCGTIKEDRIYEKQVCKSLAEEREPYKATTNLCLESDETAGARRLPLNKKKRKVENVDQLTT